MTMGLLAEPPNVRHERPDLDRLGESMEKSLQGKSLGDIAGFLYSLALVALALIGMIGVLYHAFAPNGSLGGWVGHIGASNPVFASLVIIGLAAVALTVRSQRFPYRRTMGHSDFPLYVFVIFGTFFATRWIVNGAL
jgi:hypothetical protein